MMLLSLSACYLVNKNDATFHFQSCYLVNKNDANSHFQFVT